MEKKINKNATDKGGGFLPPTPLQISPLKCQLNCSIFSWFSDSAGKDLCSVWGEELLAVPAAGQEVAEATLQFPGGVPLPPTQIRGLIPLLLLPRAKPVVAPAGVRPRQIFGPLEMFWGSFLVILTAIFYSSCPFGEKKEWKGSKIPG